MQLLNEKLQAWLRDGESERLAFRPFFGHETVETLVAFANLQGGIVLLGVSGMREMKGIPNAKESVDLWLDEIQPKTAPQLTPNVEIIESEEITLVCLSVAEYPMKPVAFEGKYYKRFGKINLELSVREALAFRQETNAANWDTNLYPGKTIADISIKKLNQQIEHISQKKQFHREEPLAFLRKYGLVKGDAITNACWLLFLPDEEPKTTIELGRFSSPTVLEDSLTLNGDLFSEVEEAVHFICKHIRRKTNEEEESVHWQYPLEAIRELVVNMIIHRDYTSDYESIIKIFDNSIEFYNSGALPDDLSIKQLSSEEYISRPRNRQIMELFKDAELFKNYGSGIQQICKAFTNYGLRMPEFIKLPGRLIVRIFGEDMKNEIIKSEVDHLAEEPDDTDKIKKHTGNFQDRVCQILALIVEDNRIPLNTIAKRTEVTKRTILRDIKKMKEDKIIERIGSEKNGYWKINEKTSLLRLVNNDIHVSH